MTRKSGRIPDGRSCEGLLLAITKRVVRQSEKESVFDFALLLLFSILGLLLDDDDDDRIVVFTFKKYARRPSNYLLFCKIDL